MVVVARNLVRTPRWDNTSHSSNWSALTAGTAQVIQPSINSDDSDNVNPVTNGGGYRAVFSGVRQRGVIFAPIGTIEPGDYYVWLSVRNSSQPAADILMGVIPLMNGRPMRTSSEPNIPLLDDYPSWGTATFHTNTTNILRRNDTFSVPDLSGAEYLDGYGNPAGNLPDHSEIEWAAMVQCSDLDLNQASVTGLRIDRIPDDGELVPNYLDGSMSSADHTYSWAGEPFDSISLMDDGDESEPELIAVSRPPAPIADDEANTLIIPAGDGAAWTLNGSPAVSGTYDIEGDEIVAITLRPADGYTFDDGDDVEEWSFTFTADPDPDPEPDPDPDPTPEWPDPDVQPDDGPLGEVLDAAAARLTKTLRWTGEEQTAAAREAYEIVLLTAWGYTRGRGFGDALVPVYPIGRVIDMAAIRLANNPEQLQRWQISGDSETLTAFQGFTLAERHVLDRYRRRTA